MRADWMRDSLDGIDHRRKTGRQLTLICLSWLLAGWGTCE